MKKVYFFALAAMLCFAGVSAYAEVLNEGFEGETFVPEGWSIIEASGHSDYSGLMRSTNRHYEGSASAMFKHPSGGDNYLVTPQLRPEADEKLVFYVISSDYTKNTHLNIKVSTTEPDQNSFTTQLVSYSTSRDAGEIPTQDWREKSIDLSAFVGQKIYIAFQVEGVDDLNMYIDAVSGVTLAGNPDCDAPTALAVTLVTADAASFKWTGSNAGQYQFAAALEGTSVDWNSAQLTSETTASVSGLNPDSRYSFYVRSYCGADNQSSAQSVVFRTPCAAASLPWKCDFENVAKLATPDCWNLVADNNLLYVLVDEASDDDYEEEVYTYAHSGTHFLSFTGGGPSSANLAVLPAFGEDVKGLKLFFWYNTGFTGDDYAKPELGYVLNPADTKSFVSLRTLDQCVDYQFVEWSLAEIPNNTYIAIRLAGGASNFGKLRIDDMEINSEYTALDSVKAPLNVNKIIENGKLVIIRDGVRYNALGQQL